MKFHEIEVQFALASSSLLPVDHGYRLYSALSRRIPEIHQMDDLAILPIIGQQVGGGSMRLTSRSRLSMRCPPETLTRLVSLSGKRLSIGESSLILGTPTLTQIKPCPRLRSRLVTIKGFFDEHPFADAVRRQLDEQEIAPDVGIEIGKRRTLAIKEKQIVGFEVRIHHLSDLDSLKLSYVGIGGRRRMGCGIFAPWKYPPQGSP